MAWGNGQGQLDGEVASRAASLARTLSTLGGRLLGAEADAQVGQGDRPPCRSAWSHGSPPGTRSGAGDQAQAATRGHCSICKTMVNY